MQTRQCVPEIYQYRAPWATEKERTEDDGGKILEGKEKSKSEKRE